MRVFLCEKPSQARDIARELGHPRPGDGIIETDGGVVTFAVGHLLELAAPEEYGAQYAERWSMDHLPLLPGQFKVNVNKTTRGQFAIVKRVLSKASEVVISTDADREGEMIGRELLEYCGFRGKIQRLWLSALDPESIRKALGRLRKGEETASLYHAALARSQADWLVGMNMTRAVTLSMGGQLHSIGRVQTPTLALVVRRDRAIENFKARDYFELIATVQGKADTVDMRYKPKEEDRIFERAKADELCRKAQGAVGPISVSKELKKQGPPKLFSLSGFQKATNAAWGWSATKALEIAQALYEKHKATTYPRTDCEFLPDEQITDVERIVANIRTVIIGLPEFSPVIRKSVFNTSKITAHHAIIPTKIAPPVNGMSPDERKAYELIARHYVACLAPDYEFERTVMRFDGNGVPFTVAGNVPVKLGWKAIFGGAAKDDTAVLPAIKDGEKGEAIKVVVAACKTTPPDRYTEGTLIEDMKNIGKYVEDPDQRKLLKETSGIGTEATRANIIATLKRRSFLIEDKKHIVSSATGRKLIAVLEKALPRLADPAETAVWEEALNSIEEGNKTVEEFTGQIGGRIEDYFAALGKAVPPKEFVKTDACCPKSGQPVTTDGDVFKFPGYPTINFRAILAKRRMSAADYAAVLGGNSPMFEGFVSTKSGRKFAAKLRLNEEKGLLEFDFGDSAATGEGGQKSEPVKLQVTCPKSKKPVEDRGRYFVFPGYPDIRAWKDVSGATVTAQDYASILEGKSRTFVFKSNRTTKPFSAKLKYNARKKAFEFEFVNK